ncbi:MAG: adenylate/guanylate cyclase domain-containing protein [Reyranellaceae bacterium]
MADALAASLIDWLTAQSLRGTPPIEMLDGLCERMLASGVRLMRVSLTTDVLHPTMDSSGHTWLRATGMAITGFERRRDIANDDAWLKSPFLSVIESGRPSLRIRLDDSLPPGRYPVLDEFVARGATDYVAYVIGLAGDATLGAVDGVLVSWLTDRPEGFSEAELALFDRITPTLALVKNAALSIETTRTLLDVYLGRDAARRVLSGNIVRGRAEPITAVIWFSDLADFTRIADSLPREQLLVLLNDYAEVIVASLEAHGGNVLKFMGDGMLAIFPGSDVAGAAARAFAAAHDARRAVAEVGARRAGAGLAVSDLYLALHVGELLYGNFGGPSRLDFTVLGPAVNEASRIAALSRTLDCKVILSSAFARALGRRDALVSLGRYALRGVALPQELFTPDPTDDE